MAQKRSYFWAYERVTPLGSHAADEGLRYARRLAEIARLHSRAALAGEAPPFPLTPADIAFEEDISESTVRRRIALARRALFGDLSDSAIYYHWARNKTIARRPVRVCAAPDCDRQLPRKATLRRLYCHPRCKRRHDYQRKHPGSKPAPHLRKRELTMSVEEARAVMTRLEAMRRQTPEEFEES